MFAPFINAAFEANATEIKSNQKEIIEFFFVWSFCTVHQMNNWAHIHTQHRGPYAVEPWDGW